MFPSSNATPAKTGDTDLCRAAAAVLCATEQTAACWLEPEPEPEPAGSPGLPINLSSPEVQMQMDGWMDGWSLW